MTNSSSSSNGKSDFIPEINTPNKGKDSIPQVPKLLASSPSGSSRPLEPIPSSTSLNNLGKVDLEPSSNSSSSSSRVVTSRGLEVEANSSSSEESEGDEDGEIAVSRYSSSKKPKTNIKKSSHLEKKGNLGNQDILMASSKDSQFSTKDSSNYQHYDTSTDGSTTTTTVLASIFDDSSISNGEEDSSPRETMTMIPTSRDSLLRQLSAEQARVEIKELKYNILNSNELEDFKNELNQLERRSKDVKHKLTVRTRIRDAAIKLRRAHRRTPSQSQSNNGNSNENSNFNFSQQRDRRNPSISTSGGGSSSKDNEFSMIVNSPNYSVVGLPSPGLPPTPSIGRNRSATFTNVGQAEVEAEASATAASKNVDSVAEELLLISERTCELRTKVVEHQAAVLAFRVDSLENERKSSITGSGNGSDNKDSKELKFKFKEREKLLIDEINSNRNQISEMKNVEKSKNGEILNLKNQLERSLKIEKEKVEENLELEIQIRDLNQRYLNFSDIEKDLKSNSINNEELKKLEFDLKETQIQLSISKEDEKNLWEIKEELSFKVKELENLLKEERNQNQVSKDENSRNLLSLQSELKSRHLELSESSKTSSEFQKRFQELQESHSKEKKLFEERARLFFTFETNLNDTEERLKTEEKNLAQMLGKVDGREEMDDLLSMIKSGGASNVKKDRLAGQGISDLLRSVSEHISDLAEELNRLGGLNERRNRPSYDDDDSEDQGDQVSQSRSIRNQFKESSSNKDREISRLIFDLKESKKESKRLINEKEIQSKLEIEKIKDQSRKKEEENLKSLNESKEEIERLKLESSSKVKEEEKSKSLKSSSSPIKSNRDVKDSAKIAELEQIIQNLKSSTNTTTTTSYSASSDELFRNLERSYEKSFESSDSQINNEELLEAKKILKELSLMLPSPESLSKINQLSPNLVSSSLMESQLSPSALSLLLQPGSTKALPSLPSSSLDSNHNQSCNNTTTISSSSSTSFTSISNDNLSSFDSLKKEKEISDLDISSLPERLRITLRSAAIFAKDADFSSQKVGKDTAEVVMEKEILRAKQQEDHQRLIDRTQSRVKGLETTVKELRQALESAHSDLRTLEGGSNPNSRPQTLRSSSIGTNGFGKGPSPTRYNYRAHIQTPQPISIPSNSLTPGINGGWRSPSPNLLSGNSPNPNNNLPLPLLTPSPRKNSFNLPMNPSSSPTPSVSSNASGNSGFNSHQHQPRTITLGMDTNQLLGKVRELEKELNGNKNLKRKAERVDQLEKILDETQFQLEKKNEELEEVIENHSKQKAQFLSEINSLNDELHSAREFLRSATSH